MTGWIFAIASAFFQVLLPWIEAKATPKAEDADADIALRDSLRSQIGKYWGHE